MTRLDEKFVEMDAIMCGYEHGISDFILAGKHEATGDWWAAHILKLSDLEKGIREYRSTLEQVYLSEAEELVGFYGFKP